MRLFIESPGEMRPPSIDEMIWRARCDATVVVRVLAGAIREADAAKIGEARELLNRVCARYERLLGLRRDRDNFVANEDVSVFRIDADGRPTCFGSGCYDSCRFPWFEGSCPWRGPAGHTREDNNGE